MYNFAFIFLLICSISMFILGTIKKCVYVCMLVAQLHLTLCCPMDYSRPGSSVHGILQARKLEWVAIPFSRGSSQPRDCTRVFLIVGRFFVSEPPGKPIKMCSLKKNCNTHRILVYTLMAIRVFPFD